MVFVGPLIPGLYDGVDTNAFDILEVERESEKEGGYYD
jgi:hypothetical protein